MKSKQKALSPDVVRRRANLLSPVEEGIIGLNFFAVHHNEERRSHLGRAGSGAFCLGSELS